MKEWGRLTYSQVVLLNARLGWQPFAVVCIPCYVVIPSHSKRRGSGIVDPQECVVVYGWEEEERVRNMYF